jgi:hypothetical protein
LGRGLEKDFFREQMAIVRLSRLSPHVRAVKKGEESAKKCCVHAGLSLEQRRIEGLIAV